MSARRLDVPHFHQVKPVNFIAKTLYRRRLRRMTLGELQREHYPALEAWERAIQAHPLWENYPEREVVAIIEAVAREKDWSSKINTLDYPAPRFLVHVVREATADGEADIKAFARRRDARKGARHHAHFCSYELPGVTLVYVQVGTAEWRALEGRDGKPLQFSKYRGIYVAEMNVL